MSAALRYALRYALIYCDPSRIRAINTPVHHQVLEGLIGVRPLILLGTILEDPNHMFRYRSMKGWRGIEARRIRLAEVGRTPRSFIRPEWMVSLSSLSDGAAYDARPYCKSSVAERCEPEAMCEWRHHTLPVLADISIYRCLRSCCVGSDQIDEVYCDYAVIVQESFAFHCRNSQEATHSILQL